MLKIWSEPAIIHDFEQNIDLLPAESSFSLSNIKLTSNADYLAGLTERIYGMLHISLFVNDESIAHFDTEITALAFDEWHGTAFYPELLAAFVTPNHPEVTKIATEASKLLEKWTQDPSLNAYQTQNPNRVLKQAAAVYGAMQSMNLVYSVPPASFEAVGQRVRLCDAVIQQKNGNMP
jgi:hypothetical protein